MLPIDPGDGQGSVTPAPHLPDIPPAQAMAHGGTIIRPGAVAWGGPPRGAAGELSSCESIERAMASLAADPGQLPGLLAELAGTRLWVPLPVRRRPFTDGTAVRLPVIGRDGTDFVPCFTSVQRLTAWADELPAGPGEPGPGEPGPGGPAEHGGPGPGGPEPGGPGPGGHGHGGPAGVPGYPPARAGRRWQRAGDAREVPHIVVRAADLAGRLPPGVGLALNPGGATGVPLYPECASYLARLARPPAGDPAARPGRRQDSRQGAAQEAGAREGSGREGSGREAGGWGAAREAPGIGHPPAEPAALIGETRAGLRALPPVREASRAWLTVPGQGEGLVISVTLDDPASDQARLAVIGALERAAARVPLRVPFPVDVTFPGEAPPDMIDDWITRNTRPFYTRDLPRAGTRGQAPAGRHPRAGTPRAGRPARC